MRDTVPLKKALERIIPVHLRALEEAQAMAPELSYTDVGSGRWNDRMGPPPQPSKDWSKRGDAIESATHKIKEAAGAIFSSGAWLAWGFKFNSGGGVSADTLEPIGPEAWNRFDVVRLSENLVGSSRTQLGFEGVLCAPLLSVAAKDRAPDIIAGRSLVGVFGCFVLADPEVQSLFELGRKDPGEMNFADAFSRSAGMELSLPLESKETVAAALEPVIAGLMREHSAELTDALAARIDALAALLDRDGVPMNWRQGDDILEVQPFGSNFERAFVHLRLPDLTVELGVLAAAPITDIAFPSAEQLKLPVAPVERKGGRPSVYDGPLRDLARDISKDGMKAKGLKTHRDIHAEIFKRARGSAPADPGELELVRKALRRDAIRADAEIYLGLFTQLAKALDATR